MTHLILTRWGYRDARTGRWAKAPPGRPITVLPQKLWRFNYGLTFTLHGEYYGAILQAWSSSRDELERERPSLVSRLQRAVAEFLGYEYGDLWYVKSDGEGFQQVPFDRALEGSWEWWIEDDRGRALAHEKGTLS